MIGRCIEALGVAVRHPALRGEIVEITVVLDACRDATRAIDESHGATCIEIEARNVGIARSTGASASIARGSRWLAFTDADSEVAPVWIARQVASAAGVVQRGLHHGQGRLWRRCAGTVRGRVHRCRRLPAHPRGESGVSSAAYLRGGGSPPLRSSEDVELVRRLAEQRATIRRTNAVRVTASAHCVARARTDSRLTCATSSSARYRREAATTGPHHAVLRRRQVASPEFVLQAWRLNSIGVVSRWHEAGRKIRRYR